MREKKEDKKIFSATFLDSIFDSCPGIYLFSFSLLSEMPFSPSLYEKKRSRIPGEPKTPYQILDMRNMGTSEREEGEKTEEKAFEGIHFSQMGENNSTQSGERRSLLFPL